MKSAELDVVVLSEDLPNEGLVKGTLGTIVMVLIRQQLAIWSSFATRKEKQSQCQFYSPPS